MIVDPYQAVADFPEILIRTILPAGVLLVNEALTLRLGLVFCGMSVMLLNQSAQLRIMIIPFPLPIVS